MRGEFRAARTGIVIDREERLDDAARRLSKAFIAAGLESPEIDARFLVQGVLQLDAAALLNHPERTAGDYADALTSAAARRLAGEPVSRILGYRDFFGRRFKITPDVLDPRPDTETLINAVLEIAGSKKWRGAPISIADIGTGSGAILVTLLAELPLAAAVATDVSAAALDVARHNAERHGVASRARFCLTSSLKGLTEDFDLVVSNPPYIATGEIAGLTRDVRNYDPRLALDGGQDGLAVYREICSDISGFKRSVVVVLEVGAGQHDDVFEIFAKLCTSRPAASFEVLTDLGGHRRCVALEIHS